MSQSLAQVWDSTRASPSPHHCHKGESTAAYSKADAPERVRSELWALWGQMAWVCASDTSVASPASAVWPRAQEGPDSSAVLNVT